jgi:nicotinate-nucleotide adenylyltransferase
VHLLEIPALAVSSTSIRDRVALGKTIKYLTPEPVEQYIKKMELYKVQG